MVKEKVYDGEKTIYAEVVLRRQSGSTKVEPTVVDMVTEELKELGFDVLASSSYSISIAGSKEQYLKVFGTTIVYSRVKTPGVPGKKTESNIKFSIPTEQLVIPDKLKNMVENVYVPPVVIFHQIGQMPDPGYPHVKAPDGIVNILQADEPHRRGTTGKNVKVAMIDSGMMKNHPYYNIHNRTKIHVHPSPNVDPIGHGTAMAANLLAIAPDCEFTLYSVGQNYTPLTAFNNAVDGEAQVISMSWALDAVDPELARRIKEVVSQGITVVCSVGNRPAKYPGFPSCMSEVISVGGAFIQKKTNKPAASNFAVSGKNPDPNYKNRQCPDVCGICGKSAHKGRLIVMPTKDNSIYDIEMNNDGNDGTGSDDGWVVGSGTSAATAQVAGGVALLLEANPNLTPGEIKTILEETATDVANGRSSTNQRAWANTPATPDPDDATGYGLINLDKAVKKAEEMVGGSP